MDGCVEMFAFIEHKNIFILVQYIYCPFKAINHIDYTRKRLVFLSTNKKTQNMQCPIVNNQNYVCSLSIFLYIRNTHRIVIIIINLIPRMCNLNINVYVSYKIKRLMRDQPSVILTRMVCGILKDSFAKEITRALDTTCLYMTVAIGRAALRVWFYTVRGREDLSVMHVKWYLF